MEVGTCYSGGARFWLLDYQRKQAALLSGLSHNSAQRRDCATWLDNRYLRNSPAGARLYTHGVERWVITQTWSGAQHELTNFADQERPGIHRGRFDRVSERRRWIMVDGSSTTRQAHGRPLSIQLRPSARREVPTSTHSPKCLTTHRRSAAKVEERLPQTLPRI